MFKFSLCLLLLGTFSLHLNPSLLGQTASEKKKESRTNRTEQDSKQEPTPALAKQTKTKRSPKYANQSHTYKTVNKNDLSLYVTQPKEWKATDRRPAVVFFHGGGWVGGNPGQFDEHCKHLSEKGIVTVQVQYRLLNRPANKTTNPEIVKPDNTPTRCIQDAKSAMRWVRSHATSLGINPKQIAAGGGSAGGHLAAFLGTTDGTDDPQDDTSISARANAMLLFNPVYNNGPGGWGTARVGDRFPEFSPAHNITRDDAPAIVFLGTEDKLISVETAKQFQKEMQDLGIKSELCLYEGAQHGFFNHKKDSGKWYRLTIIEMDRFLTNLGWIQTDSAEQKVDQS